MAWPLLAGGQTGLLSGVLLPILRRGETRALIAGAGMVLVGAVLLVVHRLWIRGGEGLPASFGTPRSWLLTDERLESKTELSIVRHDWSVFRHVMVRNHAYLLIKSPGVVIDVPREPMTKEQDAEFKAFLWSRGLAGAAK